MIHNRFSYEMPEEIVNKTLQDGSECSMGNSSFSCPVSNRGKSVPLNELLEKIPLAYSPLTKQLHIIYPLQEGSTIDTCGASKEDQCMSENDAECTDLKSNLALDKQLCDADQIEDDMSNVSFQETISPSEGDRSSLSSETSHQLEESLVDDSVKRKKRSLSSFFSR